MSYRWVANRVQPNEPEITNHKPVTDNSVILNTVNALLTSAGFNKDELNVALDVIKNAKEQSLVDKKQENVFWLVKHLFTQSGKCKSFIMYLKVLMWD